MGGRESFLHSVLVQDGVIRNLEVIGEATRQISQDLRDEHPQVPWRRIAGLRNVLIHEYLGVDLDQVWAVVVSDVPALEQDIKRILETLT